MLRPFAFAFLLFAVSPTITFAQSSFEAGVHVAGARWSEFEGNDFGIGGKVTWKPTTMIGVDADLTWYPSEFPGDSNGLVFSSDRLEGLFGVTAGPRLDRVRPFVKAAAGFLKSSEAPQAIACIAIFPPPLSCTMAAGHTLPVVELGGGVEIDATDNAFLRVDIADRMLQYPGPTYDRDMQVRDEDFFGHALRFTIGFGFRFR